VGRGASARAFCLSTNLCALVNLIEPWWKTLRSLALKGRCFLNAEVIIQAIRAATVHWNHQPHPYHWRKAACFGHWPPAALREESVQDDTKLGILGLLESLLVLRMAEACLSENALGIYHPLMRRLRDAISEGIGVYEQLANSSSARVSNQATAVMEQLTAW
jgi:hypothetical protein